MSNYKSTQQANKRRLAQLPKHAVKWLKEQGYSNNGTIEVSRLSLALDYIKY